MSYTMLIEYIPLQQGLRPERAEIVVKQVLLIEYIPLQQGLRLNAARAAKPAANSLSIFHYNKD